MANYDERRDGNMPPPTEFESERESLATVMDIIMEIKDAAAEGKTEYTSDELVEFLINFGREKKRHK